MTACLYKDWAYTGIKMIRIVISCADFGMPLCCEKALLQKKISRAIEQTSNSTFITMPGQFTFFIYKYSATMSFLRTSSSKNL